MTLGRIGRLLAYDLSLCRDQATRAMDFIWITPVVIMQLLQQLQPQQTTTSAPLEKVPMNRVQVSQGKSILSLVMLRNHHLATAT